MKLHASVAILFLTFFFAPTRGYSCVCDFTGNKSPSSMKQHAKAVFIGEVLEVRGATKEEREEYSNFYIVRMRVQRYWKGIRSVR
jgi:hypothetical protein